MSGARATLRKGPTGCPEIAPNADLANAGLTECVRVYAQGVANAAAIADQAQADVAAACDALAKAGGRATRSEDDVATRCKTAAEALTSAPAFSAMRPFTIVTPPVGACQPGPPIACGGCGASTCADGGAPPSGFTTCAPVTIAITTGQPARTASSAAALAALYANVPVLLGVMNKRNDAFSDLNRALADESAALGTNVGGAHDNACVLRANYVAGDAFLGFGGAIAGAGSVVIALYEQS